MKRLCLLVLVGLLLFPGVADAKVFPYQADVPLDKVWTVKFNRAVDASTVNKTNANVDGITGEPSVFRNFVYIPAPAGGYEPGKTYTLIVKNIKDINGKSLADSYIKGFTTKYATTYDELETYLNNKYGTVSINGYTVNFIAGVDAYPYAEGGWFAGLKETSNYTLAKAVLANPITYAVWTLGVAADIDKVTNGQKMIGSILNCETKPVNWYYNWTGEPKLFRPTTE
jgi:hypothetical protein